MKLKEVLYCNDINECVDILITALIKLREENKKLRENKWVKLLIKLGLIEVE